MSFGYFSIKDTMDAIRKDIWCINGDEDIAIVIKSASRDVPDPNVVIDKKCMWIKSMSKNARIFPKFDVIRINLSQNDEPIINCCNIPKRKGVNAVYAHTK